MTWSCAFALDPHIRFFLGLCSVFKVQCLAILAFVLLPYRVDLYIIPCDLHYVNTFFVTFLTFFRDTHGSVFKRSIMYTRFKAPKISSKKSQKKLKLLPKNGKIYVNFSKKNRADARIFSLVNSFFVVLIPFYFTSIGSLISFCCSPLLSSITKISSALPVSQSTLNNSIGYSL